MLDRIGTPNPSTRHDPAIEPSDRRPRLSILESTRVSSGASGYAAVNDSVAVAAAADECGYHRFWLTEHHAEPDIASSAPAVLVAHVAARTRNLRVGSGGVMLVNHPPLVVAEQFATLEALHPGRVDLGIGGAPGAPTSSAVYGEALGRPEGTATDYPRRVDELIGFVSGSFPAGHRYGPVTVSPRVDAVPIFLLGSSVRGAGMAAERGLAFAFAHHLDTVPPAAVLDGYRAAFQPSTQRSRPYVIISVAVSCTETDVAVPFDIARSSILVGNPAGVADSLLELAARTGADEVMVVPIDSDGPGRIRTVRTLAARFHRATGRGTPVSATGAAQ